MGTHPIFESDFDCLTVKCDLLASLVERSSWETHICIKSNSDREVRRSLYALNAFNAAILTSITKVSQPVFAQARIQFLKDGVKAIYTQNEPCPDHPILAEIARGVEKHSWRKMWLNRLINARLVEDRLQKKPFHQVNDLETYAETTQGTLLLLSLQTVNVSDATTDQAAKNMARALALTNSIRAQAQINTRDILIPLEYAEKHQVQLRSLVEKKKTPELEELVFDLSSRANANVTKVHSLRSRLPVDAYPILRQLTPVENYLSQLEHVQFDMFHPSLTTRNHLLALNLMSKKWRGRF